MAQERVCPDCGSGMIDTGYACGGPGTVGCAMTMLRAEQAINRKHQLATAATATVDTSPSLTVQFGPVTTKLVVEKGKGKQPWFWKMVARNNETLAHSEGFTRRSDAIRAAVNAANDIAAAYGALALTRDEMLERGLLVVPKR